MHGHIDFPITLNMLPYTVKKDKERVDTSKYIYDLSTVVVHKGSMDSGHYYAFTRIAGDKVCHARMGNLKTSSLIFLL